MPLVTKENMKSEGNEIINILTSFKGNMQRPMRMALVSFMFSCLLSVAKPKGIIEFMPILVKLKSTEFDEGVKITTYPGFSKVRCGAVAFATNKTTPVFCVTADHDCLVTDAARPPGYDSTGGSPPLYTCYTLVTPLIDREAALAACGGVEEGCCPSPFEDSSKMKGCVFASTWYYHIQSFSVARSFCQSMWSTADLYVKPPTVTIMDFMGWTYSKTYPPGPVWLGAQAVPNGTKTYKYLDGSNVLSSDWSVVYHPSGFEPNKVSTMDVIGVADCVLVQPPPSGAMFDEPCIAPVYYVCQIT